MKKFLSVLGAMTLTASMAATVIACGAQIDDKDDPQKDPVTDLSSIINITDLGEIKDSEVINKDYFQAALNKTKEKNPEVDREIIDNLIFETLNIYKVHGNNVSITVVPKQGYDKVIGKVTLHFTVELISLKFSLLDFKLLEKEEVGNITLQQGVVQPEQQQILNAFFLANPNYEKDRAYFSVESIKQQTEKNNHTFVATITLDKKLNHNYDLLLGDMIKVSFTTDESLKYKLYSFIKTTDLGEIKDSEVSRGNYFDKALELAELKNPSLTHEMISNLVIGTLNIYKVEGNNVSITASVNKWYDKVKGSANFSFIRERSSTPSFLDSNFFEHEILGNIILPKEVVSPNDEQILNAFFLANPNYEKDRADFSVESIEQQTNTIKKTFIATIRIKETNLHYDYHLGNSLKTLFTINESSDNELSSFIKTTDLGEIKDSEVSDGNYFDKVLELAELKNPSLTHEMKTNLVAKDLNIYKVNDNDVSITVVPKKEYDKVVGEANLSFTIKPNLKPSLLDTQFLQNEMLGEITIQFGTVSPTDEQILDAFFAANPAYAKDRADFSVAPINENLVKDGEPLEVTLNVNKTNPNYDFKLTNSIKVSFTVKENSINDLSSIITTTDLGEYSNTNLFLIILDIFSVKPAEKNPKVKSWVFDSLDFVNYEESLNFVKVDGNNLSITVKSIDNSLVGQVTFTAKIIRDNEKPILTDIKYLKKADLGELIIQSGATKPTDKQILDAFFAANPAYAKDRADFSVEPINENLVKEGEPLEVILKVNKTNQNYDLDMMPSITVLFTIIKNN